MKNWNLSLSTTLHSIWYEQPDIFIIHSVGIVKLYDKDMTLFENELLGKGLPPKVCLIIKRLTYTININRT